MRTSMGDLDATVGQTADSVVIEYLPSPAARPSVLHRLLVVITTEVADGLVNDLVGSRCGDNAEMRVRARPMVRPGAGTTLVA